MYLKQRDRLNIRPQVPITLSESLSIFQPAQFHRVQEVVRAPVVKQPANPHHGTVTAVCFIQAFAVNFQSSSTTAEIGDIWVVLQMLLKQPLPKKAIISTARCALEVVTDEDTNMAPASAEEQSCRAVEIAA